MLDTSIILDAAYSYRTYSGAYEGLPSANQMITRAKKQAEQLWGVRPTLVIDPVLKGKRLPSWTNMVWATGPAMSEEAHGSECVVIWWSEFEPDLVRVLEAVDWKKHAKDFQI